MMRGVGGGLDEEATDLDLFVYAERTCECGAVCSCFLKCAAVCCSCVCWRK